MNKSSVSIREAFRLAFEANGGWGALAVWGEEEPAEFYKLVAKLLPQEITGKDGGPIATEHRQVWKFGDKDVTF